MKKELLRRYIAELGLLAIGMLWGLGFVFVKIGLNEGMNPIYLSMVRFFGSFILLYLIFRKKMLKINKQEIKAGVILGIFQYLGYTFQTYGAVYTTAGKNAFFTAINVIIVPYIFWILHKKRPDMFAFSASILCLMGVGIMSIDREFNLTNLNIGDILTIGSAVFFAFQISLTGYYSKKINPMKLIIIQMLVAGILFAITLFGFLGVKEITPITGMTLVSVLYLTIFSTAVPTLLQGYCQRLTTSTKASILMSTESLFAPLFAYIVLGEILSRRTMLGAGIIMFAVLVSETKLGLKKVED